MLEKTYCSLFTFSTTTNAMAMEKHCHEQQLPGRLIPVPTIISAGCGLCWRTNYENREKIEHSCIASGIPIEHIYEMFI